MYILEMARALKFQSGLSNEFWEECVLTYVHIMNRLPSSVLNNKSPYEVLYKKSPDYANLRAFGCLVFSANPKVITDKLEPRGVPCVFLGYIPSQKGFRLLNLATKSVFVSRDVVFREDVFPFNKTSGSAEYMNHLPISMPSSSPLSYNDFDFEFDPSLANFESSQIDSIADSGESHDNSEESATATLGNDLNVSDNISKSVFSEAQVRRSDRIRKPSVWLQSYISNMAQSEPCNVSTVIKQEVQHDFSCFLTSVTISADPTSYKQAVKCPHWVKAMNIEIEALERNGTWITTSLPPGKVAIGCKWLYKTKFKPNGTIDRFKSRLVILGCKQQHGIDYGETFAPVAKMATVRTLLAVEAV